MNWYKIAQKENWYTSKVADNPNTSPDILRKILERGNNDFVSENASRNPNCPPETLKMVLERGKNNAVSWHAAQNSNCPPETLKMVLERGKDDFVSWDAAYNTNCPPLARILWMRATGKIGIEDPKKHIIEYEEEKVDTDLEELRKLRDMASNKNWYKIAKNTKYPIIDKLLPYIKQAGIDGLDEQELISVLNGQTNNKFFIQKINNSPTSYESKKDKLITLLKIIANDFPNLKIVKYCHQSIKGYSQEGYFVVNKNSFNSLLNALKISATQGMTPKYHEIMGEIYGYNKKEIKEFINEQEQEQEQEEPEKLNQTQIIPNLIIQDIQTNQSQKII